MIKKWRLALGLLLVFVLTFSQSALAFTDIQGDPAQAKIEALQRDGIINGVNEDTFDPKGTVTFAQGTHLIVKGLHLNLDRIRFIKEPKASDYFDYVPNDAWYASSLIIASHNGIKLKRDLQPQTAMTREQFATSLYQAIQGTGSYITNKMWLVVKDAPEFSEGTISAVQDLIKYKVVSLVDGKFRPKDEVTRSEAAEMIFNAIAFVKSHQQDQPAQDSPHSEVTMTVTPVNADVNTITLSRGSKPNPGYQITITGIDFPEQGQAVVRYKLSDPLPDMAYAAIITEPKAETYVASIYKVTLKEE
ncbi:S-layer homology domain-containing protein [Paenibacillus sp. SI8]|uniref:S-layer homology domain-containing protein n=1 Tax=unclassified Paenibacillus TaxID=185978 RepID=UPI00346623AF